MTTPANVRNDDRWWDLIERARKAADGDTEEITDELRKLLVAKLSADEIIQFDKFVHERIRDAFRGDVWGIAYIMNGGCSDDGFDYFCGWLVAQGKKHYEAALANPADAAKGIDPEDEPFELEDIWYVASHAWAEKTGRPRDDWYQVEIPITRTLQGELFDEDTINEKYPKLAKKFLGV